MIANTFAAIRRALAYILSFVQKAEHEVEDVIADFQKTIDKLETVSQRKWNDYAKQSDLRDAAEKAAALSAAAALRAEKIASNVKALVS